jgi:hypothetical protein
MFAEQGREALHVRGKWKSGTHLLCTKAWRVGSMNQAGAGWRAYWSGSKGVRVSYALCGKCVDVWGDGIRVTKATECWAHILSSNPNNIGAIRIKRKRGK